MVFDSSSHLGRAMAIDEKSLTRIALKFRSSVDDCPFLAKCISNTAEHCIQVSRVGDYFTGIVFNIDFVKERGAAPVLQDQRGVVGKQETRYIGRTLTKSAASSLNRFKLISTFETYFDVKNDKDV